MSHPDGGDAADTKRKPTMFVGPTSGPTDPARLSLLLETARPDAYLVIARGNGKGQEFPLSRELTLIGRDPEADITIDDEAASRRHAAVVRSGTRFQLRDLGSTNGTYLNGLLHNEQQPLAEGQRFRIGDTEFIFREAEMAASETLVSGQTDSTAKVDPPGRREPPRRSAGQRDHARAFSSGLADLARRVWGRLLGRS